MISKSYWRKKKKNMAMSDMTISHKMKRNAREQRRRYHKTEKNN